MDSIRRLAERIAALEKAVKQRTLPMLAQSSIENGAIQGYDTNGTLRVQLGKQFDGTHTTASFNGPIPPAPLNIAGSAQQLAVTLSWDGTFAGGAVAPMDWLHLEWHASSAQFGPNNQPVLGPGSTTLQGIITSAGGGQTTITMQPGSWWFVAVAVTQSGAYSAQSAQIEVDTGVAAVNATGDAAVNSLNSTNDLIVGGLPLLGTQIGGTQAGWLDGLPQGVIAYGNIQKITQVQLTQNDQSNNSSGAFLDLGIMSYTQQPGRCYRVHMAFQYTSGGTIGPGAQCGIAIHGTYTAAPAWPDNPTDSSTQYESALYEVSDATKSVVGDLDFVWFTGSTVPVNVKFLVSMWAANCSMQATNGGSPQSWLLTVQDIGQLPPDTAVNVYQAPPAPTAPTPQNYESVWYATGSHDYSNSSYIPDSYGDGNDIIRHGYVPTVYVNGRGAIVFNGDASSGETSSTMATALTGATVTRAQVYIASVHTYYSTGAQVTIHPLDGTTLPSTLASGWGTSSATGTFTTDGNQGLWIDVPTNWFNPGNTGIVVGPAPSDSYGYYACIAQYDYPATALRPAVRLWYTR